MSSRIRAAGSAALLLAASSTVVPPPVRAQSDTERVLRRVAGATDEDIAGLSAGAPFVRTIDSGDRRESMLVYVVRVHAPVPFVLDQLHLRHLLLDDAASDMRGLFEGPPEEADLAAVRLNRGQLRDLQRCRPQVCNLKLLSGAIERMHEAVDWSGAAASEDANRFFREMLVQTMRDYIAHGDQAGFTYEDKEEPLEVEEGFHRLLRARYLNDLDASFRHYLVGYPQERPPGTEDVFTWTVEDIGIKSLISLNHIAFKPADVETGVAIIGVKRFYSSHYFQAGLRTITLVPVTGDPAVADTYVAVFSGLRFDGELGGIKRVATERRLERNAESVLERVREQLESSYVIAIEEGHASR